MTRKIINIGGLSIALIDFVIIQVLVSLGHPVSDVAWYIMYAIITIMTISNSIYNLKRRKAGNYKIDSEKIVLLVILVSVIIAIFGIIAWMVYEMFG